MKIMISQPMKGKTTEQIKQERDSLVQELNKQGHEIVETIFDDFTEDKSAIYYLAKSLEKLDEADGVVFMPEWEKSRGCRVEYDVATNYGKFIKEA